MVYVIRYVGGIIIYLFSITTNPSIGGLACVAGGISAVNAVWGRPARSNGGGAAAELRRSCGGSAAKTVCRLSEDYMSRRSRCYNEISDFKIFTSFCDFTKIDCGKQFH